MFLIGVFSGINNFYFISNALEADGEITDVVKRKKSKGSNYSYVPEITFNTHEGGQRITFEAKYGENNKAEVKIGQKVGVLYLKSSPNKARVNSQESIWAQPLIHTVFGVLILGWIGIRKFIKRIKEGPRRIPLR